LCVNNKKNRKTKKPIPLIQLAAKEIFPLSMLLPSAAKQIKTRGERKRESHIFHTKSKKNKKKKKENLSFSLPVQILTYF
jgi:hypothetical protein